MKRSNTTHMKKCQDFLSLTDATVTFFGFQPQL